MTDHPSASVTDSQDTYRRRREAGEASRARTRETLLRAADALFREQGYVATTVTQIVRRAGVSVQTLYLAWGSKRALLRAAADRAATGAEIDAPPAPDQWRSSLRGRLEHEALPGDLPGHLVAVARIFTELAERSAPYWEIYRQAAAVDAEIAHDWAEMTARRRTTLTDLAEALPSPRSNPSAPNAALTLFALASPDTYELLTRHAGCTPEDYRRWLTATLVNSLEVSIAEPRKL
ncbi:TetR/AcrR family transcriptional regulator [Amycolatopsis sp. NPDC004378]